MYKKTKLSVFITAALSSLGMDSVTAELVEGESSRSEFALEEVVVTAQFRKESLQDAGVPLAVVDAESMERSGVISASQLSTLVPALQINSGGKGTQAIYVRGVGTPTANTFTEPGVAFNVDGVYYGQTTAIHNTFYDLQRVEVLKGPQGILYGRNATGGAINVLVNTPEIGEWGGYLSGSLGNEQAYNIDGAINIPVSDNSAARIAFTHNKHDGYLSDGTSDADDFAIRGQWLIEPSNDLSVRFAVDYTDEGGSGTGSTVVGAIDGLSYYFGEGSPLGVGGPTDFVAERSGLDRSVGLLSAEGNAYMSSRAIVATFNFAEGFANDADPFSESQFWGAKVEVNWDTDVGALTIIAAHRESEFNGLDYGIGFLAYTDQEDEQTTFELRFTGELKSGEFSL